MNLIMWIISSNSVHAQIEEDANKGDIINIDNIDNSVEVE